MSVKLNILLILIECFYLVFSGMLDGVSKTYIRYFNHTYPSTFTLASNQLLLAFSDGLYLYDSELSNGMMILNITLDDVSIENMLVKQFSLTDGGHILVILKNILYVFDSNAQNYIEFNLSCSNTIQSLILINEGDNYLSYSIISYKSNYIYIHYYKYNLNANSNELIYSTEFTVQLALSAVSCTLMIQTDSKKKLITCIYNSFNNDLYSSSFDLENNLTKLDEYDVINNVTQSCGIILLETNENKSKSLIICKSYYTDWQIFDIDKKTLPISIITFTYN